MMRSLSTTPLSSRVGLVDRAGWRAVGGVAGDGHRQDRAGVEDQVEPLVELEPRAVLDVGLALLGPAARTLPPTVHVNLSPRQFAEPHLIDLVAGALADTGTDPDRLCLEVTERALAANPAAAATTLKRLSTLGLTVIAEGVEPPRQLAKLDQLGCDYAQGYCSPAPTPPPGSASSSATTAAAVGVLGAQGAER